MLLDHPAPNRTQQRAFSYLDVMLAVVIVGVAIAALMQSMASTTKVNAAARQTGVAVNLARNLHEYAMSLSMSNVDALNNRTYATPIASDGNGLTGYTDWSQAVQVSRVQVDATHDIKSNVTTTTTSRLRRLTVQVRYKGGGIYTESWLIAPTGF